MERARRLTALFAAVLLVMVMATAAYAAEGPYNVWIDIPADSGTDLTLTVPVKTDGTVADGLTVISYDPAVLSVAAEDVSKAGADMYSANVTEPGTLKVSWIIGDEPKTGAAVNVTFTVLKQGAATGLDMTGEAYSAADEETARTVGANGHPVPTPVPTAVPTAAPTATPAVVPTGAPTVSPEPTAQPENVEVEVPSGQGAPSVSIPAQDQQVLIEGVLSEEEKKLLDEGVEIVITLQVSDVTNTVSAEDKAKVEQTLAQQRPDYTLGQYLDVSLFKVVGDGSPEKIDDILGSQITVVIAVPEGLKADGRSFQIVRLHDGAANFLEDKDNDPNTITIQTDRFSTYAIVFADGPVSTAVPEETAAPTAPAATTTPAAPTATAAPGTTTPRTGDDAAPVLWAMMAAVCAAGVVLCVRRLRRGSM